ncbi:DTW domain-containing protein 2, partial [Fasciola gigantica]
QAVCWCPWLPCPKLSIKTNILILQHPFEEQRKVRTARILEQALVPEKIRVFRGRRFCEKRFPELMPILASPGAYLLYPHRDAVPADMIQYSDDSNPQLLPPPESGRWLIVVDGTWTQARNMVCSNPVLTALKKIRLPDNQATGVTEPSAFIVRRQPFVGAVSTVEAVARVLDLWEPRIPQANFYQASLLRPLHQMCEVQGAWKRMFQ